MCYRLIEKLYLHHRGNLVFYDQNFEDILTKAWITYLIDKGYLTNFNLYIAMVDLNGLKVINDKYGHNSGDNYVKSFIEALRKYIPVEKCIHNGGYMPAIIRFGGDEFVIISYNDITERLDCLQNNLNFPFSYGVAQKSAGMPLEVALDNADKKMYEMKNNFYETHSRQNPFSKE